MNRFTRVHRGNGVRGGAGERGAARWMGASATLLGWALLVLVSVAEARTVVPAPADVEPSGGQQQGGPPPVDGGECFDELVKHQKQCQAVHCSTFGLFWIRIWTSCDEPQFTDCNQAAQDVFKCCMTGTC